QCHSTVAAQPGLDVADADLDIVADAALGDLAGDAFNVQQGRAGNLNILTGALQLVRVLAEYFVVDLAGHRNQVRVGHPGTVETVSSFAGLVLADLAESDLVDRSVLAVGNESAHAADGRGTAAVAGTHQLLGVSAHERSGHGHGVAIREDEARAAGTEVLDDREDVVPTTCVQARGVLTQLVQDLFHLESSGDGLDQHGGANGAAFDIQQVLGHVEDVVPQPCFQMVLQLRQVVVRAAAGCQQALGVVEEVQSEVHQCPGHRGAGYQQ